MAVEDKCRVVDLSLHGNVHTSHAFTRFQRLQSYHWPSLPLLDMRWNCIRNAPVECSCGMLYYGDFSQQPHWSETDTRCVCLVSLPRLHVQVAPALCAALQQRGLSARSRNVCAGKAINRTNSPSTSQPAPLYYGRMMCAELLFFADLSFFRPWRFGDKFRCSGWI